MNPKISVIVPVYNADKYLLRFIGKHSFQGFHGF